MYNVLMFGTGKSSIIIENVLNCKVKILAYVDNNESKWGTKRNNILIVKPEQIKNYDYDYIIIASQFNEEIYNQLIDLGVVENKIFQYYKFMDNYSNEYKYMIDNFIENNNDDLEAICTGISYAYTGFSEKKCLKSCYKFSLSSQDIFYDYHTIKYLFNNFKEKVINVKYAIIGLCYYSFQYDMSLSAMKNKVVWYYSILKTAHHYSNADRLSEEYENNREIAEKTFRINGGYFDFVYDVPSFKEYENKVEIGRKQAELDCNKDYPKTVQENIQIFKDYLRFLKDNNIKPIVVVFPASKYYTEYFSKRIEDEFYCIINQVKKEYNFQYIDYFRSELFDDDDFSDVSHLNNQGAEKFTKMLNEEIEW
ncbi:chemotaxis protein [Clostridium sp. OS1-26]|uniref:chemotaxis protein n=1 Tax=Clostridium sp. OS1-26 TaxID=3070681 RepID=UPI0027E17C5A|nr:chemotaxis protein [Clostridium sp. OS1-26]WML35467.1 chemotaxis protein [Clostridium sp. OS1-26]